MVYRGESQDITVLCRIVSPCLVSYSSKHFAKRVRMQPPCVCVHTIAVATPRLQPEKASSEPGRLGAASPWRCSNQRADTISVAEYWVPSGSPPSLRLTSEMVRAAVRRVETAGAVEEFAGMSEQAARALYRDRMLAWVSVSFAILAAPLCAIGNWAPMTL